MRYYSLYFSIPIKLAFFPIAGLIVYFPIPNYGDFENLMSNLLDKALASWEIAEELHPDDTKINFVANRYYYALFQAATWNNEQSSTPLKKNENEGTHQFAKRIVDAVSTDTDRMRIFRIFKSLRITADYKPTDVNKHQLNSYNIQTARDLLLELAEAPLGEEK